MVARQAASHENSAFEESTFQLVMDQLEELVATLIEEVRERPAVVVAIGAAILGIFVGSRLAAGRRRSMAPPRQAMRKARRVGDVAELVGLGMRLMQNPIVRGLVMAAIARQMRRRLEI